MKDSGRKKKKSGSQFPMTILILLFTCLLVFSAIMLVKETIPYVESRKEYEDLQQFVLPAEQVVKPSAVIEEASVQKVEDDLAAEVKVSQEEGKTQEFMTEESVQDEVEMEEMVCPLSVDFEALWAVNPDIKGWIYLEALEISYPIVQGVTNEDYIYTSVKGSPNNGGSIFMDCRNNDKFTDPHTVIYGHNMKNGSMFGKLKKLYSQKFVDEWEAPLGFWIITPEGSYRYDIFSIHTVLAAGETYTLFAEGSTSVAAYINTMVRQTGVKLPQKVYDNTDKVITLSTCTSGDEYRLVVQGVLHVE